MASASPMLLGATLGLAALLAVAGWARRHPWHNVLLALGLLLAGAWGGEALLVALAWPQGVWPLCPGPCLPGKVPVLDVVFWVAALASSRALARFCLWPWRQWHFFGFGLLAVSVLAATLLAGWIAPAGWRLAPFAAALLLCVTPSLIVKTSTPPSPEALGAVAWLLLAGFLAAYCSRSM